MKERLDLVKEVALLRYEQMKDTPSDVAPILWQHGGISRLKSGETIGRFLKGGYATYSVGYIGLYETIMALIGKTHTTEEGRVLAHDILSFIRNIVDEWKEETDIGFALYGTPSENMAGRLCNLTKERYGIVKDITDKGYFVNSYHVDVREEIDAFSKLEFEAPFQRMSTGGGTQKPIRATLN